MANSGASTCALVAAGAVPCRSQNVSGFSYPGMTCVSRKTSTTSETAKARHVNARPTWAARRGDSARKLAPIPTRGRRTIAQVRLRMIVMSGVQLGHLVEVGAVRAPPQQRCHSAAHQQLGAQRSQREEGQRIAESRYGPVATLCKPHRGHHGGAEQHAEGCQGGNDVAPGGDAEET